MYLDELFEHKITEGFYVDPSTTAITITFDPNTVTKDEFNSMLRDVSDWQHKGAMSWMVNGTPVNDALSAANWMKAQIQPRVDAATNTRANQPKLRIDNPGGDWLQGKIDYAKEKGPNKFGMPYMSTVTGTFNGYVQIPVSILKNIPGARGEQQYVRQDSLDWLTNYMKTNNKLPPMSDDNDSEYAPFIMVGYDGTPWVNEGNHRIMAAAKLGWKSLPVEIRYFDGGEAALGPLNPDKLRNMVTENKQTDPKLVMALNESAMYYKTAHRKYDTNGKAYNSISDSQFKGRKAKYFDLLEKFIDPNLQSEIQNYYSAYNIKIGNWLVDISTEHYVTQKDLQLIIRPNVKNEGFDDTEDDWSLLPFDSEKDALNFATMIKITFGDAESYYTDKNNKLVVSGKYTAVNVIKESAENVLKDWKGWWITDKGEQINVDPENDYHHWQAASEEFADYLSDEFYDDDGLIDEYGIDAIIDIAKEQGWIRVYDRPDEFGMEFDHLNDVTKRRVMQSLRQHRDKLKIYINNEVFYDVRKAQRYIREL